MKTTLNPFENAKRTAQGTGGIEPSVIEEIQAEITVLGSQNEIQAQDITDIKAQLEAIAMASNTDYLTNKKLNGKPVYMRYIDLDGAVGNRDVLTDVDNILSINLRIASTTLEIVLPNYNLQYSNSFSWRLNTTDHKIEYTTNDNNTTYGMRGYIEYTKTGA